MRCGSLSSPLFTSLEGDPMTDFRTQLNTPDPTIQLPAPTAWPVILAFGFTLVALGLVTSLLVSLFGAVFMLAGCLGWFAQVLPHQAHVSVPVDDVPFVPFTSRKRIERIRVTLPHRA